MIRAALLVSAAAALVLALSVALVPFDAELETRARDGRRMELTVGIECRAPVLDGLGLGDGRDDRSPRLCDRRARTRLLEAAAAGVAGTALLVAGLRHRPGRAAEAQVSRP
jgi:hypothetical protein